MTFRRRKVTLNLPNPEEKGYSASIRIINALCWGNLHDTPVKMADHMLAGWVGDSLGHEHGAPFIPGAA